MVAQLLFEVCPGHVLILLDDAVIDENIGKSFDLMSWDLELGLNLSHVVF